MTPRLDAGSPPSPTAQAGIELGAEPSCRVNLIAAPDGARHATSRAGTFGRSQRWPRARTQPSQLDQLRAYEPDSAAITAIPRLELKRWPVCQAAERLLGACGETHARE